MVWGWTCGGSGVLVVMCRFSWCAVCRVWHGCACGVVAMEVLCGVVYWGVLVVCAGVDGVCELCGGDGGVVAWWCW
jgi:hypothetical protein